jgi:hypothetical protein
MVIHPLAGDQVNRMLPQTLGDDSIEGFVAVIVVKDRLLGIAAIQGIKAWQIAPASSARGGRDMF